ncbi:MAG: hypothetical protein ACKVQQ_11460 [Burkholderiales bacterium]
MKRMVAPASDSSPPDEHVLPLDERRKTLLLLDLKAILRRPGTRLALPNLANLEMSIERNARRVRIPHNAMLVVVRELLAVRKRIPPKSPLLEIMHAVPGLAHTVLTMPLPISRIIEERPAGIRIPPVVDVDAEAAEIRSMIAKRGHGGPVTADGPPAALPSTAPAKPSEVDDTANARSQAVTTRASPPTRPSVAQVKPLAVPSSDSATDQAGNPPRVSPSLSVNSANMSALDQRLFLEKSVESFEAVALRTHELSDADLAAFVDLCILNKDHARGIDVLFERAAAAPRAWVFSRLIELAEESLHPRMDEIAAYVREWAEAAHPELVERDPDEVNAAYLAGVRREGLKRLGLSELASA